MARFTLLLDMEFSLQAANPTILCSIAELVMYNHYIGIRTGMLYPSIVQLVNAEMSTIMLAVWLTAGLCFLQDTRCQSLSIFQMVTVLEKQDCFSSSKPITAFVNLSSFFGPIVIKNNWLTQLTSGCICQHHQEWQCNLPIRN